MSFVRFISIPYARFYSGHATTSLPPNLSQVIWTSSYVLSRSALERHKSSGWRGSRRLPKQETWRMLQGSAAALAVIASRLIELLLTLFSASLVYH